MSHPSLPVPNQMIFFLELENVYKQRSGRGGAWSRVQLENVRDSLLLGDRNRSGWTWYRLHQEDSQGGNNSPGETTTLDRIKDQGECLHMVWSWTDWRQYHHHKYILGRRRLPTSELKFVVWRRKTEKCFTLYSTVSRRKVRFCIFAHNFQSWLTILLYRSEKVSFRDISYK